VDQGRLVGRDHLEQVAEDPIPPARLVPIPGGGAGEGNDPVVVVAEELRPSLRWAIATTTRAPRRQGQ
jgi:hypothetical protein